MTPESGLEFVAGDERDRERANVVMYWLDLSGGDDELSQQKARKLRAVFLEVQCNAAEVQTKDEIDSRRIRR